MNIRILTNADAAAYQQLRLNSYQEAPLAFSESYEDEKLRTLQSFEEELTLKGNPPEWYVLGAFSNSNALVGFVKFKRDLRSKARHKSMVHAMYVDPTYRGHQIGKKLMEEVIHRGRQMEGLEQIHLWVLHAEGTTASGFYATLGFIRQGPLVLKDLKFGGVYIDAEYMVLHL